MRSFGYAKAPDVASALAALATPGTEVIAGGTELVNWLKEGIATPDRLLDITGLPLGAVEASADGLRVGALARMSEVAAHPVVAREYPVLAEALLAAASAQLRTMATIGGNIPAAHPLSVLPRGDVAAVQPAGRRFGMRRARR